MTRRELRGVSISREDRPQVSELCLGTMAFGAQTDDADSARIMDAFVAAGGTFIDTADAYTRGESESVIGR